MSEYVYACVWYSGSFTFITGNCLLRLFDHFSVCSFARKRPGCVRCTRLSYKTPCIILVLYGEFI